MAKWRPDGATEAEVQDMNKLALSMLASGYLCHVYPDTKRPGFMPLWNYAFNQGGPDPDYVYLTAELDPAGTYRISGFRGTSRFVEITQQTWDMLRPSLLATGRPVRQPRPRRRRDPRRRRLLQRDPEPDRPEGHDGDWWEMMPETARLIVRSCAADWRNEVDVRLAIERLDDPGADMTPGGDRATLLRSARVDRGDDRVRHGS